MATYEWEKGARLGVKAQVVGEIVSAIETQEGICPPGRLVEIAKPKRSPIHKLFEWDDSTAAGRYRDQQARHMLNHLRVRIDNVDEPVPAFVRIDQITENGVQSGYADVVKALSGESRALVFHEVQRQLQGLRRRLRAYKAAEEVLGALDEAITGLDQLAA